MPLNKSSILLLILLSFSATCQAAFKTSLSDTHVQSVLQSYFPLKEYAAIARVTLQEPKVHLAKTNKLIVLMIPVDAKIIGDVLHHGHITVQVKLNYKASSGGLYLSKPHLEKFEMPSVSKAMVKELHEFIETILKNSLPLIRIYKLKEKDINHSLAKTTLKVFQVVDRSLKLEFGFK